MAFRKFNRAESYQPVSKEEIEAVQREMVEKTIMQQEAKIETAKLLGVDPKTL